MSMNGNKTRGMSIAGLVLAIIGIIFAFVTFAYYPGFVIGIIAGIIGIIIASFAGRTDGRNGIQLTGLILSIVAIALCLIIGILYTLGIIAIGLSTL